MPRSGSLQARQQGDIRVEGEPVTMRQFAAFVRAAEKGYFDCKHWPTGLLMGEDGGDKVLELVRFHWEEQDEPVRGVTWFEAAAYCRWKQGRLPYARERQQAAEPAAPGFFERLLGTSKPVMRKSPLPEWCADWYNRCDPQGKLGPEARPDEEGLKRVLHHEHPGLDPRYRDPRIVFRVVRPLSAAMEEEVARAPV
jgi:formylglycine-generating enzyme required for sulfatase activity